MSRASALRAALLAACLSVPATGPAAAHPRVCLPPIFDGGQRIHALPAPRVFWLELLLRQHEICWRRPRQAGEVRIALVGNSAIYGFPLPAEQTVGGLLNQDFAARDIPAHVFNLASVATYQLRDALVIHEALPYEPSIIVYPLTLSEFAHIAPAVYPRQLVEFLSSNKEGLLALAANPPEGLAEPLGIYQEMILASTPANSAFFRLREIGALVRVAAQRHARAVVQQLSPAPLRTAATRGRQTQYDCAKTIENNEWQYPEWRSWNILSYLQRLQDDHGLAVLVVNWPVAHEPVDACYNVRYGARLVADFNAFLREETRARGLPYLDLHDLLAPDDFLDSLHVSPAGHARIAVQIAAALEPMIQARTRARVQQEARR